MAQTPNETLSGPVLSFWLSFFLFAFYVFRSFFLCFFVGERGVATSIHKGGSNANSYGDHAQNMPKHWFYGFFPSLHNIHKGLRFGKIVLLYSDSSLLL